MKPVIFGIFAHPDDESFGPSGYIVQQIRESDADVHLITLTAGENGSNPDRYPDLGTARLKEWHEAGRLMGATSQHHLGYVDGQLCNNDYLEIVDRVTQLIDQTLADYANPSVELLTNDLNGITGHIDHIVAARAANLIFYRDKQNAGRLARLRMICLPKDYLSDVNTDWLYMEPGRDTGDITEVVDARRYRDDIVAIMRAHHSQRADCETHLKARGDQIGLNYFIVRE